MKKKSNKLITTLLVIAFLVGLSLLLYPTVSNYWNSLTQSRAIVNYTEAVDNLDEATYAAILESAHDYNRNDAKQIVGFELTPAQKQVYEQTLNISQNGVMGYVDIPSINCTLPIYHGTDKDVMQVAIGHLEWSELPVGGEGNHSVLSGHRGLPSAKLFTDLDKMEVGDIFMVCVLNEVMTYEVDQILIVKPHETDALHAVEGEDLCTLLTCTPYGVNSHRLLVRGHRVTNTEEAHSAHVISEATQIEPLIVAPVLAIPVLLALCITLLIPRRKKTPSPGGDTNEI